MLGQFPELGNLKNLRATLKTLEDNHHQASNAAKQASTGLSETRQNLEKTRATISRLQQELAGLSQARTALLQGHSEEHIGSLQQEQQERIQQFEQLLALALDYHKLANPMPGVLGWLGGKPKIPDDPDALALELEALQDSLKREENIRLALESALHREALVGKLLTERVYLVHGKPCPLCGAKEHPYLHQAPLLGDSAQALADRS